MKDEDTPDASSTSTAERPQGSALEVLWVATRLGLTSFGGPIAHIGYFRAEYVDRRRWLEEEEFADLLALSQFLPGPASSKLGMSIGILRAGLRGGIASWIGFTMPSAVLLVLFAFGSQHLGPGFAGWLHGLMVVAVAVVALAVWNMARSLAFDKPRGTIAIVAAIAMLSKPIPIAQVLIIVGGGLIGWRILRDETSLPKLRISVPISRRTAIISAALFVGLLIALPVARHASDDNQSIAVFDTFYRGGSLVFGGGHVVLPVLQAEVVPRGWVTNDQFLAGYGAAQAVPGPLFTFAAYLGAVMKPEPNGVPGAVLSLVAIFLPAWLLTVAILPLWGLLRASIGAQAALRGINAAVVGILLAALYTPVATSAILKPTDFALAIAAFAALAIWKLPPWLVVLLTAAAGGLIANLS